MGHVYLARSTGLGGFERHVVVKLLDVGADDDDLVAMFLDEARVLGALHHQFIAPIYDVGRDSAGRYFLVMEYVRGETATQVVQALQEAGSGASLPLALSVVAAIASALDYAHDVCATDGTPLEIVHRDVSPSNIMIGHEGDVKLIDFGIAKFAHRTSQTQIGSLKGKLGHLSPEQILHKPVDRRADIFSLGIVLYELTTLTRAFEGASELIILEKIIHGDYVAPSKLVRDYPPDLERIVRKAMSVDPARRFQDAGAFGRELEAFATRHGVVIGHGAVRDEMTRLFSGPSTRRRFPRASSEVSTGRLPSLPPVEAIDDGDVTPVEPIEMLEVELEPSVPVDVPTEMVVPIAVAPVVVRIATPVKAATVTAELPKKPASHLRWWLPLLVIVLGVAAALVVKHW